mgnify:CR=1 FL=1
MKELVIALFFGALVILAPSQARAYWVSHGPNCGGAQRSNSGCVGMTVCPTCMCCGSAPAAGLTNGSIGTATTAAGVVRPQVISNMNKLKLNKTNP